MVRPPHGCDSIFTANNYIEIFHIWKQYASEFIAADDLWKLPTFLQVDDVEENFTIFLVNIAISWLEALNGIDAVLEGHP